MKQFISFVRKEFYHIFRDARTTMILLLMPVILIILFGYAITTEIKRVPIAIFDQSRDELTLKMTDRLNASIRPSIAMRMPGPCFGKERYTS